MKALRRKKNETAEERPEQPAAQEASRPERKSGLLSECIADLRGRPRPKPLPEPEPERMPADFGGVGIDEVGYRRMQNRYGGSTMTEERD